MKTRPFKYACQFNKFLPPYQISTITNRFISLEAQKSNFREKSHGYEQFTKDFVDRSFKINNFSNLGFSSNSNEAIKKIALQEIISNEQDPEDRQRYENHLHQLELRPILEELHNKIDALASLVNSTRETRESELSKITKQTMADTLKNCSLDDVIKKKQREIKDYIDQHQLESMLTSEIKIIKEALELQNKTDYDFLIVTEEETREDTLSEISKRNGNIPILLLKKTGEVSIYGYSISKKKWTETPLDKEVFKTLSRAPINVKLNSEIALTPRMRKEIKDKNGHTEITSDVLRETLYNLTDANDVVDKSVNNKIETQVKTLCTLKIIQCLGLPTQTEEEKLASAQLSNAVIEASTQAVAGFADLWMANANAATSQYYFSTDSDSISVNVIREKDGEIYLISDSTCYIKSLTFLAPTDYLAKFDYRVKYKLDIEKQQWQLISCGTDDALLGKTFNGKQIKDNDITAHIQNQYRHNTESKGNIPKTFVLKPTLFDRFTGWIADNPVKVRGGIVASTTLTGAGIGAIIGLIVGTVIPIPIVGNVVAAGVFGAVGGIVGATIGGIIAIVDFMESRVKMTPKSLTQSNVISPSLKDVQKMAFKSTHTKLTIGGHRLSQPPSDLSNIPRLKSAQENQQTKIEVKTAEKRFISPDDNNLDDNDIRNVNQLHHN